MGPEIETFTSKINATSVRKLTQIQFSDAVGTNLIDLRIFKRENYFILEKRDKKKLLIIKISRSEKPFGRGRNILDKLNGSLNNYYLVLLEPSKVGYLYSKSQLNWNISQNYWHLAKDNNYKIYGTLDDGNHFLSVGSFLTSELF